MGALPPHPKGKDMVKKVKAVNNKKVRTAVTKAGEERLVIVETGDSYVFTNLRNGMMFFKRETGKDDFFKGHETKKDITEKEREMLLSSQDYALGYIIEESDQIQEINNKNSLTAKQLNRLFEQYSKDIDGFKNFLEGVDSEFALKRIKDEILSRGLPSSLFTFCDYRIKELEEAYEESQKAPDFKAPDDL